ncbi:MAG: hypothetical protein HWN68_09625 [Desulfobacterales bacterium]|nr:hypothetical protein [Desulfobacterales bacterium]
MNRERRAGARALGNNVGTRSAIPSVTRPASTANAVCRETCVFYGLHPWEGDGRGDCEFEFLRRWLQKNRVPTNCPRGLVRKGGHKKPKTDLYAELRPQVLDAMKAHPSNVGFKPYQVANLMNGYRAGKRNSKWYNEETIKRIRGVLQDLRAKGMVYSIRGRWFVPTRDIVRHVFGGVAESNQGAG